MKAVKHMMVAILAAMAVAALGFAGSAHAQMMSNSPMYNQPMYSTQMQQWRTHAPLSQLLGKEVRGTNGQALGTIRDFVLDQYGRIEYALLSTPGNAGRMIAVPFEALAPSAPLYFSMNATPDKLANAPVFSLNNLNDPSWNQQVYQYYGLQPSWYQAHNQPMGFQNQQFQNQEFSRNFQNQQFQPQGQMMPLTYYDLNRLVGMDVRGMNGENLGRVKDFVLDPNGHIFALVTPADSNRTVAVPFEAFSSVGTNQVTMNIDRTQLANAPSFSRSALTDPTWSEKVYRSFGIQPQWGTSQNFQYSGTNY